jgi:haloalkane dehalogenase
MPSDGSPRIPKSRIRVLDAEMAFVDRGAGPPVVFLHGNSSKLPDSGPGRYSFAEHRRHLDALLAALGVERDVVLVVHDWGSALGFDWARRHEDRVRGIAYMEAIVRPYSWADMGEHAAFLRALRGPDGETLVLRDNAFVEQFLPRLVMRELGEEEMEAYRRPFREPGEARRATLDWPRQIPLDGEPGDVVAIVQAYADWLSQSDLPKLFINAEPGAILIGAQREFCRSWPNQTEVTVRGSHFIQQDSPSEIGRALADWYKRLDH